jgi:Fe2+ transport system protein FeoA
MSLNAHTVHLQTRAMDRSDAAQPGATGVDVKIQQGAVEACCRPLARRVALSELRNGEVGVVSESALDETDAAFLRAMGLCNEARVRLTRAGEPCIVTVGSDCGCAGGKEGRGWACRIGLARPLAERIFVTIEA